MGASHQRSHCPHRASLLALALAILLTLPIARASAQTPSPLGEWQYEPGVELPRLYGEEPRTWDITLGAGAEVKPSFPGSGRYAIRGGPDFDIRYRDRAFLSLGEGVGADLLQGDNWRVGASVGYDLGRSTNDDRHLTGFNNISAAPVPKLYAAYIPFGRGLPLTLRADIRKAIGGFNGVVGDLSVYMPVAGTRDYVVFVGASATFADTNYMQSWFGVNPQQSTASGFPIHQTKAGLESWRGGVSMVWFFAGDQKWFVDTDLSLERLMGSAADSPIVSDKVSGSFSFSLGYRF